MLPLFGDLRLHGCHMSRAGQSADVGLGKATASYVAFRAGGSSARPGGAVAELSLAIRCFGAGFGALSPRGHCVERGRHRVVLSVCVLCGVGPFVRDCETESGGTVVFVALWWYLVEVGLAVCLAYNGIVTDLYHQQ
ncbi:hypothetical protein Taro_043676 [Colocasia esculenta]|uniref:Uncharacterized protein n=1 Tax=Colocasia esculenta TaxID=4460 RepID=A0A843WWD4_COLES|nr:hypothetical protein [Colocasia esculenta]